MLSDKNFLTCALFYSCASENFLRSKFEINQAKPAAFVCEVETADLEKGWLHLSKFVKERNVVVRSTVVQTSPVNETFEGLFDELVCDC